MKLRTNLDVFERKVLSAIARHLNSSVRRARLPISRALGLMAERVIKSTGEYTSIIGGELRAELGLTDPMERMEAVIDTIRKSIQVKITPIISNGKTITGGLTIGVLRADLEDILALPEAKYVSNQFEIDWLRWITVEGDMIIIQDFEITYDLTDAQIRASRSKEALMKKGGTWQVPEAFRGFLQSNFLTKAFDTQAVKDEVTAIILGEFVKHV
jgi:hypothetical protein